MNTPGSSPLRYVEPPPLALAAGPALALGAAHARFLPAGITTPAVASRQPRRFLPAGLLRRSLALACAAVAWASLGALAGEGVALLKQWEREFGTSGDDALVALQATPDGGAILAGHASSGPGGNKETPGYGGADYWVIKMDSAGEKVWERTFGGTGGDYLRAVVCTRDGGYVLVGYSTSGISGNKTTANFGGNDVWLIKVDGSGNQIWEGAYGGSGQDNVDTGGCLIQTRDGGFVLAASSASPVSGNKTVPNVGAPGTLDWWILKLEEDGQKTWEKVYGGLYLDEPYSVRELAAGYLIAGRAWSTGGNKTTPGFGYDDAWVLELDPNGDRIAEYGYGWLYSDAFVASLPLPDGGYWLGGFVQSAFAQTLSDAWIVRMDASGAKLVEKRYYAGMAHSSLYQILPMSEGTFLAAGFSTAGATGDKALPSFGGMDWWLFSFDGAGTKLQEWALGGSDEDALTTAAITTDGGYLLGGSTKSGATGNKTSPHFGERDWWLVKLTVEDHTPPTVICPSPLTTTADGACQAVVPDIVGSVSASDDCTPPEALVKSQTPAAGTSVGSGVHSIVVTVTDAAGNSANCTTTLTVWDTTPPTIDCPADITTVNDLGVAGAVVTWTPPMVSDNCSETTLAQTAGPASGSLFPVGTTTVTYTATDAAGNTTTCSLQVKIKNATEQISDLLAVLQSWPIHAGLKNALSVKLQAALAALQANDQPAACGVLKAFLNQVSAQAGKKLTVAQATQLTHEVTRIRSLLGCQ